jgi:hypothetical protein
MIISKQVAVLFSIVFCVFSEQTSILHLTTGEKTVCSLFKEKVTSNFHYFLCNGDTLSPGQIKGLTDSSGYHPYSEKTFLKCKTMGNISFYSGDIQTVEPANTGRLRSRAVIFNPVILNKTYYTFNDSQYHEFSVLGSNKPLIDALKLNADAYLFYTRYRLSNFASVVVLCSSVVPLIGGLFILNKEKPGKSIGLFFTSAAGFTACGFMRVVVGKRCFTRSIDLYNGQ